MNWFLMILIFALGFICCAGPIKQLIQHNRINTVIKYILELKDGFTLAIVPVKKPEEKKTPNK